MLEKWKEEELPAIMCEIIAKAEWKAQEGKYECHYNFRLCPRDISDLQTKCLKKELISHGFINVSIGDTVNIFATGDYYRMVYIEWK
ncbi:MAG: hypothetical protein U9M90_03355 [Patescibacteria group bacterium]|nr:hypothetical protein [Patescibacteria group bacterium]